jgi:Condensation domain
LFARATKAEPHPPQVYAVEVPGRPADADALADRLRRLSPARRAELARSLRSRLDGGAHRWPLTPTQFGIWFHEQLDPGSAAYNNPAGLRLRGPLDLAALERALRTIHRRHDLLRARFDDEDGEAEAVIEPELELPFRVVDITGPDPEADAARLADEDASRPFDLATGPPWRALLLRLRDDDHVLVVTLHHLVSDGWSLGVLMAELRVAYSAFARGEEPALPPLRWRYVDVVGDEARALGREREALVRWWTERLAGFPQRVALPYDRSTDDLTYRGATVPIAIEGETTATLDRLARAERATLFAALLATLAAVLAEASGQRRLIVSTPLAGRDDPRSHGIIGCFLNTVALPLTLEDAPTPRELVQRSMRTLGEAIAHGRLPFGEVAAALSSERASRVRPITNVMLLENNAPLDALSLPGLEVERYPLPVQGVKQDWAFTIARVGDRITGELEYTADRFEPGTVARAAARFAELAERLAHAADEPLSRVVADGGGTAAHSPSMR